MERDTVSEPSKLDIAATAAVNLQRGSWHALVDMAVLLPEERIDGAATELSKHMRQGKDSLKRKINAILYCRQLGHSVRQDMASVAKILGFVTSEQLWDFMHSILGDLVRHPEALKQLAGQVRDEKKSANSGR